MGSARSGVEGRACVVDRRRAVRSVGEAEGEVGAGGGRKKLPAVMGGSGVSRTAAMEAASAARRWLAA